MPHELARVLRHGAPHSDRPASPPSATLPHRQRGHPPPESRGTEDDRHHSTVYTEIAPRPRGPAAAYHRYGRLSPRPLTRRDPCADAGRLTTAPLCTSCHDNRPTRSAPEETDAECSIHRVRRRRLLHSLANGRRRLAARPWSPALRRVRRGQGLRPYACHEAEGGSDVGQPWYGSRGLAASARRLDDETLEPRRQAGTRWHHEWPVTPTAVGAPGGRIVECGRGAPPSANVTVEAAGDHGQPPRLSSKDATPTAWRRGSRWPVAGQSSTKTGGRRPDPAVRDQRHDRHVAAGLVARQDRGEGRWPTAAGDITRRPTATSRRAHGPSWGARRRGGREAQATTRPTATGSRRDGLLRRGERGRSLTRHTTEHSRNDTSTRLAFIAWLHHAGAVDPQPSKGTPLDTMAVTAGARHRRHNRSRADEPSVRGGGFNINYPDPRCG